MPIDRGVIDQQLHSLGESPGWWDLSEFRDLPTVLHADERILAISRGKVARLRWLRRSWLIVVTDRRLVCLRSAGKRSWRQLEVDAGQINRVALRIGPFHGRVVLVARSGTYRLLVSRSDGYKLSSSLSTLSAPVPSSVTGLRPIVMVRRIFDHVLALPAIALGPDPSDRPARELPDTSKTDERIESLEGEVEELREQIRFLEQLLNEKQLGAGASRLPPADRQHPA